MWSDQYQEKVKRIISDKGGQRVMIKDASQLTSCHVSSNKYIKSQNIQSTNNGPLREKMTNKKLS